MPPLSEVQYQLAGLWLLVKGDARGLSHFDISDEGVLRSFFSFVYCLPAIVVHAILRRVEFLQVLPDLGRSTTTFLFQAMALQAAGWTIALATLLLTGLLLGLRPLLRPLTVMFNWAALPALYLVYGIIYPLVMLVGQSALFGLLSSLILLAALIVGLVAAWLGLRTIVGGSSLRRGILVVLVALVSTYSVSILESSMGLRLAYG